MRSFRSHRRLMTTLGLLALVVVFLLVVLVSSQTMRGARVDLTSDKLYTLTPATLGIIDRVEQPIQLTLYFSEHATRELPRVRSYEQRVREMLREVTVRSHGRIRLRVIDPVPFSDDMEAASGNGLTAMTGSNGESVFFGLVGNRKADGDAGDSRVIAYLDPNREAFLEYDVAKLLYELGATVKPRIGIISSLPLGLSPLVSEPPWTVVRQMQQLFDVHMLDAESLKAIDPSIKVLLVIHPKHLTDDAQYAIDQYVLHGGRLAVFVDPLADADTSPYVNAEGVADDHASDLPRLFAAWGIGYDPGEVVLDRSQSLPIEQLGGVSVNHPAMLWLGTQNINHNDAVTASLQRINVSTAGHIELLKDTDSTLVPLMQTSAEATLVPVERVREIAGDPSVLLANYRPMSERYVLAARVRGQFRTAFPERHDRGHLDRGATLGDILVVADTDLLTDRLWLEAQNLLGSQVLEPFANNGDMVSNIVDNLSGSSALLSIRGRAGSQRAFTRVQALQAEADQKFATKRRELERELQETQSRLRELQPANGSAGTSEQKQEYERKQTIAKELRDVQHQLDAEIDALGLRLKFVNIVLVPALVALFGLIYGWRRTRRMRRRVR